MTDVDKLQAMVAGYAMRYIRNDGEPREDHCLIELADSTEDEMELAFTLHRDRYYLRVRKDDLRRLIGDDSHE